jgi:hypothetical protein
MDQLEISPNRKSVILSQVRRDKKSRRKGGKSKRPLNEEQSWESVSLDHLRSKNSPIKHTRSQSRAGNPDGYVSIDLGEKSEDQETFHKHTPH